MCESRQHRLGTVTAGKGFTPIPLLRQFRMAAPRVARKLPHGDRAVAWQESLLRALVLAYPVAIPKLLEGDGGSRHAAAALASVGTLLGRCTSDKEAKALSGELRQLSVQERPSSVPILRGVLSLRGFTVPEQGRILFQLSRFGRAGPYAQQDAVHTAEEQHRTDLTRQFPVPRRLRKSAFRFAARWSHGKASSPAKVSFGASAGSDSSRAKGGWRAVVKTVTDEFRSTLLTREDCVEINTLVGPWVGPFKVCDLCRWPLGADGTWDLAVSADRLLFLWEKQYAEDLSWSLGTWELQREFLFAIAACLWACRPYLSGAKVPVVSRSIVRERGSKVRVVTPLPSCLAFLGTALNSWVLGLLAMDPRTDPYPKEPIGPVWPVGGLEYVRSADLTRATDLIPGPLAQAIALGLAKGQGLQGTSVEQALRVFTNPMVVSPRRGGSYLTNGCPLMGAGPSWPVLCLFNLWLAAQAFPSDRIRVVGDDLGAVGSLLESQRYDALLRETGGSVSESKDTLSRFAGCLVERFCAVQDGRLVWHDTVSVGSLMGTSRVFTRGSEEIPMFARGPGLASAPGVPYLVAKVYATAFQQLRAYGLNPYVPREFGGPGFPGTPAQVSSALKTLRPHWVRALRVSMSQGIKSVVALSSLQGPWSGRSVARHEDLDSWVSDEIRAWDVPQHGESSAPVRRYTLEEFERELYGRLRSAFDLCRGFEPARTWALTVRNVSKGIENALTRVNALVPYPELTDRARNIEKGLQAFLSKIQRGYFVVPPEFRVSPGIGAVEVGSRVVGREAFDPRNPSKRRRA